jgi:AcrR family transcriptional regulator
MQEVEDRKAWERTQREKRIIDIAQAVFVERGYAGTSVPAVAAAAGYHKRTIYLYFKDKDDIFLAVVVRCLQLLRESLVTAANLVPEDRSGLKEFAWAFFCFAEEYPEFMDLIMRYESRHFVYHEADKPDDYGQRHAACQAVSDEIAAMATAAIERGIRRGILETDLEPRQLMLLLWGQILGVIQILRIRERHFEGAFGLSREDLFSRFVQMVERALTPQT